MSKILKTSAYTPVLSDTSTNDPAASTDGKWPVAEFHPGLGDHPLWQDLMDEIAKNRQADIAEANRVADLELAELEQRK